jgi:hypothetical protein
LRETRTLVLTIGHSTHSIEAFIGLLQVHGAEKASVGLAKPPRDFP